MIVTVFTISVGPRNCIEAIQQTMPMRIIKIAASFTLKMFLSRGGIYIATSATPTTTNRYGAITHDGQGNDMVSASASTRSIRAGLYRRTTIHCASRAFQVRSLCLPPFCPGDGNETRQGRQGKRPKRVASTMTQVPARIMRSWKG